VPLIFLHLTELLILSDPTQLGMLHWLGDNMSLPEGWVDLIDLSNLEEFQAAVLAAPQKWDKRSAMYDVNGHIEVRPFTPKSQQSERGIGDWSNGVKTDNNLLAIYWPRHKSCNKDHSGL